MNKLAAAQALAERGFKVFPIKAGAKTPPLWKNWPERAAATVPANWPQDANIGIHCEGLVVLDIDVRNGGIDSLVSLTSVKSLPATLTTLTPTGGRHLFYRLPAGHPGVPNGANKLGPGIDVKSTRGYVLAPGSEVPAGRYRFEADVPIADAPEWLVQALGEYTPRERGEIVDVPDAPTDVVARAEEWLKTRPVGDEAFKTACGLRDFGLSQDQATDMLWAHDGRSYGVIQDKVEHAYRYAQNAPGSKAASAEDFPVVEYPNGVRETPKRVRPKLLRLTDLARQKPGPYLVKGLLQRASHAVIFGPPGEGKTFVALDISYHVAAGREWQGRKVHAGPVLYLAYEGIGGMVTRAAALVRHYGDGDVPLYIAGADYDLREQAGRHALRDDLAQLPAKPVLVVIDTLARALKGGDENSAQDMGALNDAVGALIAATGACVVLIHHSGKNKASGARGSSALKGAIDTEIEVDSRLIQTRKQRDVESAAPLGFKLLPVQVGTDEDDDPVMSCVVEACQPVTERLAGLSENARLGLDAMTELAPDNEPVDADLWRGKCREFLPEQDASARKAFYRIRRTLEAKGLVEKTEGGKWQRRME